MNENVRPFDEVDQRCREIAWPATTEMIRECGVIPTSAGMPEAEVRKLTQQFWDDYVYPTFLTYYCKRFPHEVGQRVQEPGVSMFDYNLKLLLSLCDWLEEQGYFHHFQGRIVFVTFSPFPLSMGALVATGAPIEVYEMERVAGLLNGMLGKIKESNCDQARAHVWMAGLLLACTMLALLLFANLWN